ncbi:hypothetical protein DPM13_00345 [Paracoccus mutanolyticus]|uniref:Transposase n=1 Tax=Paracoccus mutanolyticus TaxID=1499308 RepID=A0ABM6WNY2_9RHOB|nr:hypothetical protein DPM13_00345 [Paracoccus mutanolyticus]
MRRPDHAAAKTQWRLVADQMRPKLRALANGSGIVHQDKRVSRRRAQQQGRVHLHLAVKDSLAEASTSCPPRGIRPETQERGCLHLPERPGVRLAVSVQTSARTSAS